MADASVTDQAVSGSAGDLFESCPVPVLVHDPETGAILDANEAFEDMFGYDATSLVEMDAIDFSPTVEDPGDRVEAAFARTAETGDDELDWEITDADGRTTEVQVQLRRTTLGDRELALAFVTDVSTSRKRERVLDGLHDVATELLDATTADAVADITTRAAEHVMRTPFASVRFFEDDSLVPASMTAGVRSEQGDGPEAFAIDDSFIGETFEAGEPRVFGDLDLADGSPGPVEIRSAICIPLDTHGVFTIGDEGADRFDEADLEIATLLTSLTTAALDQIRREARLADRTDELGTLLNNAPIIFYEIQPDGTISVSRGRVLDALGVEPGELTGANVYDVYEGHEGVLESVDRAFEGERFSTTIEIDDMWLDNTYQPVFAEDGTVERLIGVSFDVTEVKALEEKFAALSESGISLSERGTEAAAVDEAIHIAESVLEESVVIYWKANRDEGILTAGAVADDNDVLSVGDGTDLVHEEGDPVWQVFEAGETVTMNEFESDDAADAAGLGSVILAPVGEHGVLTIGSTERHAYGDRDQHLLSILGGILRTTLNRLAYEAQIETSQMELERSNESLQQFAYVASHDLQEPLRMVSSYVSLLEDEYGDELEGEAEEYMDYAVNGASRMQGLINGLLQYARVHSKGEEPTDVDTDAVLDETIRSLELLSEEEGGTIDRETLPAVRADEGQLGQLLQNLLKNALQHGGEDPMVTVAGRREDDVAHLTVADEGPGIPESQHERVFEIFKGDSGREDSTGIGLAVCERIVNRHGGDLWVESANVDGTTFHVTLPAAAAEMEGSA